MTIQTDAFDHELKCDPQPFEDLFSGHKTFELRKNDRDFMPGDSLLIRETCSGDRTSYTGRIVAAMIKHILRDSKYGLKEGYVILSLDKLS